MKTTIRLSLATLIILLSTITIAKESNPRVLIKTSMGDITLELDSEKAPETVENFLRYVEDGFYDDTIFHRVINGFVIQGGGYTPELKKKATYPPIINESDNGLTNQYGTISMARTSDPHSATAQFFINVNPNSFLDFTAKTPSGWGYAVFGSVIDGFNTIDKIEKVRTGQGGPFSSDVPQEPVIIKSATLISSTQKGKKAGSKPTTWEELSPDVQKFLEELGEEFKKDEEMHKERERERLKKHASQAASEWLTLLDEGHYTKACNRVHDVLLSEALGSGFDNDECKKLLKQSREKLGPLKMRKNIVTDKISPVSSGFTFSFETVFSKGTVQETIIIPLPPFVGEYYIKEVNTDPQLIVPSF